MSFFLNGKFACWIVPEYRLLEIRMVGFWTEADMETIGPELRRRVDEASGGGKDKFKVLLDATAFETQSEAVREIIVNQNLVYAVSRGLEKSARIVGKAANEMQFKSMGKQANSASPGPTAQFAEFYSRGEALKWLGLPFFLPRDFTKDL
jgi:hypothetical protein